MAFSPDGRTVASAGEDNCVRVFKAAKGDSVREFTATGTPNNLAFSPDGKRLAAACDGGLLQVWEIASRERTTLPGHRGHAHGLAFCPTNAHLLASSGEDGTIRFWDLASGGRVQTIDLSAFGEQIESVAFTPDGRYLMATQKKGIISILNVPGPPQPYHPRPPRTPVAVQRVPDTLDPRKIPLPLLAKVRRGEGGAVPRELVAIFRSDPAQFAWVAVSPDGKTLAAPSPGDTIRLWNLGSGQPRHTLTGHTGLTTAGAFSPHDGKMLATGGVDGTIKLWDVSSGREQKTLRGHTHAVTSVAFNSDRSILATASRDGTVKLWPVGPTPVGMPRAPVRTLLGPPDGITRDRCAAEDVSFSPDGKLLALAGEDGVVRLWDVATGWQVAVLHGHKAAVRRVAFHPDGSCLASSSADGTIRLWDVASRKTKQLLEAHECSLVWRADGRLLATAGDEDGLVRLWDLGHTPPRCKRVPLFPGSRSGIRRPLGAVFTPEGHHLAVAGTDGIVCILRLLLPSAFP